MSVPVSNKLFWLVKSPGRDGAGYHSTLRLTAYLPGPAQERMGGWLGEGGWHDASEVAQLISRAVARFDKPGSRANPNDPESPIPNEVGSPGHSAYVRDRYRLAAEFSTPSGDFKIVEAYSTPATQAYIDAVIASVPPALIEIGGQGGLPANEFIPALAAWKEEQGIVEDTV